MRSIRARILPLGLSCVFALTSASASGQDLFELEVFEYESTPRGQYHVEFHTNGIFRGSFAADSVLANHRPLHLSVEVTRGWTNRFETAVFIQTAPFGSSGSARFAGGHLRGKLRFGQPSTAPVRMAVSAEYTFNRAAFDRELQTLEIRPIVDYAKGRLSLVANPTLELVTQGTEAEGLAPVFDVSARAAWQLRSRVSLTTDYFSAAATTRHLQPEPQAHHLVFSGVEWDVGSGWEVTLSAGHCVTSGREPWLMKSVLGYRF
jgi:hypothetical protein